MLYLSVTKCSFYGIIIALVLYVMVFCTVFDVSVAITAYLEEQGSSAFSECTVLESVTRACEVSTDVVGEFIYMLKMFLHSEKSEFCKKMIAFGYPEKYVINCIPKLTHVQKSMSGSYKLTSFKWRIDISFLNRFERNT